MTNKINLLAATTLAAALLTIDVGCASREIFVRDEKVNGEVVPVVRKVVDSPTLFDQGLVTDYDRQPTLPAAQAPQSPPPQPAGQ